MLDGKRIIITGANGGIGNSICELMLQNNANLIMFYHIKRDKIDQLLEKYKNKKSNCEIFKINLLDENEIEKLMKLIISKGDVDCMVHCVTVSIIHQNILKNTWKDYQTQIELQTKSFLLMVNNLIPSMKNSKHGKIVNILTSYVVGRPPTGISPYVVGKYSLLGLSKSLAVELGQFNITVNSISPSMTNTPLIENLPAKFKEINVSQIPLKRLGEPKDVASMAMFLCSENSDYVSGENFLVTGAGTMH